VYRSGELAVGISGALLANQVITSLEAAKKRRSDRSTPPLASNAPFWISFCGTSSLNPASNICLDSKKKICSLKYRVDFPYLLFVRIFNPFGADGG